MGKQKFSYKPRPIDRHIKLIPCELRLPSKSGNYLVVTKHESIVVVSYSSKYKLFNCYDTFEKEYVENEIIPNSSFLDVLYWAPLEEDVILQNFNFDLKTVGEIRNET